MAIGRTTNKLQWMGTKYEAKMVFRKHVVVHCQLFFENRRYMCICIDYELYVPICTSSPFVTYVGVINHST